MDQIAISRQTRRHETTTVTERQTPDNS